MKTLLLLATITAVSGFLEIDELRKMVPSYTDRAQLEILDEDDYTPRSQIQERVNAIVQRQSSDIQNAYNIILRADQSKKQYEQQRRLEMMRNTGVSQEAINVQEQIYALKNNYELSKQEAKNQIRSLIMGVAWPNRRFLDD